MNDVALLLLMNDVALLLLIILHLVYWVSCYFIKVF